ncbi:hypothetical protein ACGF7U_14605 [Micromonospora sp. NPDC047670]|uniref:hypothetical protein n=1 Tax=Micromonospora sp. NPDC047670 TaxID=3364252 RepID=UPI00371BAEE7
MSAALNQTVRADTASIVLGRCRPGSGPRRACPTTTPAGRRSPRPGRDAVDAGATGRAAALTVTPARLTIPAGGRATAPVRLDTAATAPNQYTGVRTATGAEQPLRIPVGLGVTPPVHTLTPGVSDPDGQPATGQRPRERLAAGKVSSA